MRAIVGCRLDLVDALPVLVYPTDRPAYARLCRLLSLGKSRGGRVGGVLLGTTSSHMARAWSRSSRARRGDEDLGRQLRRLRDAFGNRAYVALTLRRRPNDQLRLHDLSVMAQAMRVPTVVTNDVLFHEPDRRILQDVVTCIRHNVTIDNAGFRRERHADRYLKPPGRDAPPLRPVPRALARTSRSPAVAASPCRNSPISTRRSASSPT